MSEIILDEEGVSLERISTDGTSNDSDNWISASENCGFATPGLPNSQSFKGIVGAEVFNFSSDYFSPNGDGINDFWNLDGISIDHFPNTVVYIFDRYGRLLKEFNPLFDHWDGTFRGNPMPATDYWFRGYLDNGIEFKGHFSLYRTQ